MLINTDNKYLTKICYITLLCVRSLFVTGSERYARIFEIILRSVFSMLEKMDVCNSVKKSGGKTGPSRGFD